MIFANKWEWSSTLIQMPDELVRAVRFCGRVLKESEINYHRPEREVLALLQLLKITHDILAG